MAAEQKGRHDPKEVTIIKLNERFRPFNLNEIEELLKRYSSKPFPFGYDRENGIPKLFSLGENTILITLTPYFHPDSEIDHKFEEGLKDRVIVDTPQTNLVFKPDRHGEFKVFATEEPYNLWVANVADTPLNISCRLELPNFGFELTDHPYSTFPDQFPEEQYYEQIDRLILPGRKEVLTDINVTFGLMK